MLEYRFIITRSCSFLLGLRNLFDPTDRRGRYLLVEGLLAYISMNHN